MISSSKELSEAANKASRLLQDIQDYLGSKRSDKGKVKLPQGFTRSVMEHTHKLPALNNYRLSSNISYALLMIDILRWLEIRTDLGKAGNSMVIKESVCILGAVCESLTKAILYGKGSKHSYERRSAILVEMGIITKAMKVEIDWVWNIRKREHLWEIDSKEHSAYSSDDYNRALRAYTGLRDSLKKHFG